MTEEQMPTVGTEVILPLTDREFRLWLTAMRSKETKEVSK